MRIRGQLTPEIVEKSIEFLGYSLTKQMLRLLPLIDYQIKNESKINMHQINNEEGEILTNWQNQNHLIWNYDGSISVNYPFYLFMNDILYLSYVKCPIS